jgi:hypothetical protein
MNTIQRCCLLLFLLPLFANGQEIYELDSIVLNIFLHDPAMPQIVKDYSHGHFVATDDDKTFQLLDTLTKGSNHFFKFYFYLFNKIVTESDGALSELLGGYCFNMIYNHPGEILTFFTNRKHYQKRYAFLLGEEFYFKERRTSTIAMNYPQFCKYLNGKLNLKDERIRMTFTSFKTQIQESMKSMD